MDMAEGYRELVAPVAFEGLAECSEKRSEAYAHFYWCAPTRSYSVTDVSGRDLVAVCMTLTCD